MAGRLVSTLLYAALSGALLAAFYHNAGGFMFKHLFSLLALLIGIRYFRLHDSRRSRIAFVAAAVVLSFVFSLIYTMLALAYDWPLDPRMYGNPAG